MHNTTQADKSAWWAADEYPVAHVPPVRVQDIEHPSTAKGATNISPPRQQFGITAAGERGMRPPGKPPAHREESTLDEGVSPLQMLADELEEVPCPPPRAEVMVVSSSSFLAAPSTETPPRPREVGPAASPENLNEPILRNTPPLRPPQTDDNLPLQATATGAGDNDGGGGLSAKHQGGDGVAPHRHLPDTGMRNHTDFELQLPPHVCNYIRHLEHTLHLRDNTIADLEWRLAAAEGKAAEERVVEAVEQDAAHSEEANRLIALCEDFATTVHEQQKQIEVLEGVCRQHQQYATECIQHVLPLPVGHTLLDEALSLLTRASNDAIALQRDLSMVDDLSTVDAEASTSPTRSALRHVAGGIFQRICSAMHCLQDLNDGRVLLFERAIHVVPLLTALQQLRGTAVGRQPQLTVEEELSELTAGNATQAMQRGGATGSRWLTL